MFQQSTAKNNVQCDSCSAGDFAATDCIRDKWASGPIGCVRKVAKNEVREYDRKDDDVIGYKNN
jgi:hypothetical protein